MEAIKNHVLIAVILFSLLGHTDGVPRSPQTRKMNYCEQTQRDGRVGRAHTSAIFLQNPVFFVENDVDLPGFYIEDFNMQDKCGASQKFKELPVVEWFLVEDEKQNDHLQFAFKWSGKKADGLRLMEQRSKFVASPPQRKATRKFTEIRSPSQLAGYVGDGITNFWKKFADWVREKFVKVSILAAHDGNGEPMHVCTLQTYLDNSGTDSRARLYACPKGICVENTLFFLDKDFWGTKQTVLNVLAPAEHIGLWQRLWHQANAQCQDGLLPILDETGSSALPSSKTLGTLLEEKEENGGDQ